MTVLAGLTKTRFVLHRKRLSEASAFFQKELAKDHREDERVISLPEIEASYFQVYASWIYDHELDLTRLHATDMMEKLDPAWQPLSHTSPPDEPDLSKLYTPNEDPPQDGWALPAEKPPNQINQLNQLCDHLCRLWIHSAFLSDPAFQTASWAP